eukprot:XP_011615531.1 PREDICTED: zinc finger CCCH domain-containing protein 7B-like [Takifugu rubripes]
MDPARQKRRDEINKSLAFIQSSLAYSEPDGYQGLLTKLVFNLLEEGNTLFKEEKWKEAVGEFTEGLNVSLYAAADNIDVPEVLRESLYVNRAAAYQSLRNYELAVKDCEEALVLCEENRRALYRKAVCLKELGKYREAYECTTRFLLISRLDKQVNDLAQELAVHLGLKNRKPYISTKEQPLIITDNASANCPADAIKVPVAHSENGLHPLSCFAPVTFPSMPQVTVPSRNHVSTTACALDSVEDSELMGEDLDSLLDQEPTEVLHQLTLDPGHRVGAVLPPAFISPEQTLDSLDFFTETSPTGETLDALDDLLSSEIGCSASPRNSGLACMRLDALDSLDSLDDFSESSQRPATESKPDWNVGGNSLDDLDPLEHHIDQGDLRRNIQEPVVNHLDSLDDLDTFPSAEAVAAPLDSIFQFNSPVLPTAAASVMQSPQSNKHTDNRRSSRSQEAFANPLSSTHKFLQACSACFPRKAPGTYAFIHKPDLVHKCQRDVLLCKRKVGLPSEWTKVRPLPLMPSFNGPFVLCKDMMRTGNSSQCKFGENCTFAYNQLEIDVWTMERTGKLDRNFLFETSAKLDPANCIIRLLQEFKGVFVFLCQTCFDGKPRTISRRDKGDPTICSGARHSFDANKCLVFEVNSLSVRKVRPLSVLCRLDLCQQAVHMNSQREDGCNYAHSVIELKTWMVQRHTGISHNEIVKVSTKYYEKHEQTFYRDEGNKLSPGGGVSKPKGGEGSGGVSYGPKNMKIDFACAQCWQAGLKSLPDKALKYCSGIGRHKWTKDRLLLLVTSPERKKWVQVRPLPHVKHIPNHYDMCVQVLKKKKCSYPGNCTFAHSQEEREMWTYMKNNDLHDMDQIYNMWLAQNAHSRQSDEAALTKGTAEEKKTAMPTDYAESLINFYCHLCGRHSNGDRQWEQHISSERHKDRVFSCEGEDEALMWIYRFPGTCFKLCPKLDDGCSDGVSCDYAHSPEELQEWRERRDFLRKKLARAKKDMFIMPDEVDFGKYNFLLQD